MDAEERLKLITRNAVEVVTPDDLRERLKSKGRLRAYIGFEPSGLFHIGWMIWAIKVKDLVKAGVEMILLRATWHAWINDKLGGNMELIRKDADYIMHCLYALGIEPSSVKAVDADELVDDSDYWALALRIAKNVSLARVKRALTIMGRKAEEAEIDFSKLIYPAMQATDIFYLGVDIALGGMDQRKVHMLARELAPKLGKEKPIALHTPILTNLQGAARMEGAEVDEILAEAKMSKSKPEYCIFIHDPPEAIREKIRRAYCPPRQASFNPVLEINKYILFAQEGFVLHIDRPAKYGGPLDVYSYEELEKLYIEGKLHPLDLKNATAEALIKLLEPVRRYFESNAEAKRLLEEIKSAKPTR